MDLCWTILLDFHCFVKLVGIFHFIEFFDMIRFLTIKRIKNYRCVSTCINLLSSIELNSMFCEPSSLVESQFTCDDLTVRKVKITRSSTSNKISLKWTICQPSIFSDCYFSMSIWSVISPTSLVNELIILIIDKQVTLTNSLSMIKLTIVNDMIPIIVPCSFSTGFIVIKLTLVVRFAKFMSFI